MENIIENLHNKSMEFESQFDFDESDLAEGEELYFMPMRGADEGIASISKETLDSSKDS